MALDPATPEQVGARLIGALLLIWHKHSDAPPPEGLLVDLAQSFARSICSGVSEDWDIWYERHSHAKPEIKEQTKHPRLNHVAAQNAGAAVTRFEQEARRAL